MRYSKPFFYSSWVCQHLLCFVFCEKTESPFCCEIKSINPFCRWWTHKSNSRLWNSLNYWLHPASSCHPIPEAPLEFTFLAHWRVLLLLRNGTQPFMSVFMCFFCLCRASAPRGAITSLCWRRCVLPGSPWNSCCASFRRRASVCSCVRL